MSKDKVVGRAYQSSPVGSADDMPGASLSEVWRAEARTVVSVMAASYEAAYRQTLRDTHWPR